MRAPRRPTLLPRAAEAAELAAKVERQKGEIQALRLALAAYQQCTPEQVTLTPLAANGAKQPAPSLPPAEAAGQPTQPKQKHAPRRPLRHPKNFGRWLGVFCLAYGALMWLIQNTMAPVFFMMGVGCLLLG